MFLQLGIKNLRNWEEEVGVPATFLLKDGRISEVCVILDSQGHRYLIYVTSRRPAFMPWTIVAVKQFGSTWENQQLATWKAFPWSLRSTLNMAREMITKWIADCSAKELSQEEALKEVMKMFDSMK